MKVFLLISYCLCFSFSLLAQSESKFIVVDQFGYLPSSKKVAVIRDPNFGFDQDESFSPGTDYAVVNKLSGVRVFSGSPVSWNEGQVDESSGDKAWWFDFSSLTAEGNYYVLDVDKNLRSFEFEISPDVYNEVLKQAVRTFFYQRAGYEKKASFAGAAWADEASHIGPLQDKNARPYDRPNDASIEKDVSGGWYDAGDYNKYTNWTANYVVDFMRAYLESPSVWSDNYNIPESGNGIPDILDEAKWGIDHLLRMQEVDGGVLSIVGLSHGSPPSSATGPSLYGDASTSATLNTAAAFAIASKVFAFRGDKAYADTLANRAVKAWNWAEANPSVLFKNNDAASGTSGLGAGQQETDDYGRFIAKLEASVFLFEITGENKYKLFFDANYRKVHMMEWTFAFPFEANNQQILLYYTMLADATENVATDILSTYKTAMNGVDNFPAVDNAIDPYLAHIQTYTWGSNSVKALQGLMFTDMITYEVDAGKYELSLKAAEGFIHYIHGVNPLNLVYLSNMYDYGAEKSVNEFYHTWFWNGSAKWDRVGVSTYGPAPGFVTGGPNPSYDWDACCPDGCGGNSTVCESESLEPPKNQPDQKSYKDFNTSWPINSWSVTENSNGYQINYIRLLSKLITAKYDCSGTLNGSASYDICNKCSGGTTGVTAITNPDECSTITSVAANVSYFAVYPNPTAGIISIDFGKTAKYRITVLNALGEIVLLYSGFDDVAVFNLNELPSGVYFVKVDVKDGINIYKILKK